MPADPLTKLERVRKVLLPLILFASCLTAARAERLPLKIYTTVDGLAHNAVNRIVRDSRGFLWFCTHEGLSRFDGYEFTNYGLDQGLPSAIVNDLLETREGEYWVATAGGMVRFNPLGAPRPHTDQAGQGTNAMFTAYSPVDEAKAKTVNVLLQDRAGAIWCGTGGGLYRMELTGGEVKFAFVDLGIPDHLESRFITSLLEDRRGVLWVGASGGLFRRHADGRVDAFATREGVSNNNINSLLEDATGRIWVSTRLGGLFRLTSDAEPGGPAVARAYAVKDGLPTNWINQIFQDSKGGLWAGSSAGLIQFVPTADGADFRFRTYAEPHGLTTREVGAVAEDRNGNLWLGMQAGGALKLARSGFTAYGVADGFYWCTALYESRAGELLVVGGASLAKFSLNRFDGERFAPFDIETPDKMSWGWNQVVLEDRTGEWWVATRYGVHRFRQRDGPTQLARARPRAVYTTRDGLTSDVILRLFEDSRGDIWIGSVGEGRGPSGLSRWERATETFHHYTEQDGLPSFAASYVSSFVEDRAGHVWIGFNTSGGLVRYREGRFERFTAAEGLPAGSIRNLFVDSLGRMWAPTTRGGLVRVDDPVAARPAFVVYSTANGLASNFVTAVTEDNLGRIYAGTGRGVDRIDPVNGRIRHYTTADGLLLGEAYGALRDRQGALWFGFNSGPVRFTPEPDEPPLPPPILITSLGVAGESRPVSALGQAEIAPLVLGPDENQLQVDFVALGYSSGEGLKYQYRLEGAGGDWSPPTEQRTVNFANLAPGSYRLLVRAANADGTLSERPATVAFKVLPPIFLRWWFLTLVTLGCGLVAYAAYRYRVTRLLEVANMRTRIATDLHDDIGANLTKIAILSEVARQQSAGHGDRENKHADGAPAGDPLDSIARISRESVAAMSDIVWAVNPERDRLLDLVRRMRQHAEDTFTPRDIRLDFHAPDHELHLRLGVDVRRDLFLVFKEATNNAARHAGCTRVDLDFRVEGPWLLLRVADDGAGFDAEAESEGQGLASMRRRARASGGKLEVESVAGQGTTISFKVPRASAAHPSRGDSRSHSRTLPQ